MKNSILCVFTIIALSSCSSYQYVQLKSDLDQTTKSQHYYHQDDNVYLDFDFSGVDLPMSIYLENIGSDTLYFDLSRTLYLVNDVIVRNAIPDTEGRIKVHQDYKGQVTGVKELETNQNILVIPSGEKLKLYFNGFQFPYNKKLKKRTKFVKMSSNGKLHYLNKTELEANESPDYEIDFFFATDPNFSDGYDVVCVFSPASVFVDSRSPKNFPIKDPNVFYTSRQSHAGGAFATVIVIGVGLIGIIAVADTGE